MHVPQPNTETIGYKRRPSRVYRWMQWNMAADLLIPNRHYPVQVQRV